MNLENEAALRASQDKRFNFLGLSPEEHYDLLNRVNDYEEGNSPWDTPVDNIMRQEDRSSATDLADYSWIELGTEYGMNGCLFPHQDIYVFKQSLTMHRGGVTGGENCVPDSLLRCLMVIKPDKWYYKNFDELNKHVEKLRRMAYSHGGLGSGIVFKSRPRVKDPHKLFSDFDTHRIGVIFVLHGTGEYTTKTSMWYWMSSTVSVERYFFCRVKCNGDPDRLLRSNEVQQVLYYDALAIRIGEDAFKLL